MQAKAGDWWANEVVHYRKRTLKRLEVTSRSLIALIEPGSCFAGSLLELALAADRSYQLSGVFEEAGCDAGPAAITVAGMNLGPLPMGNGLTRLQTRFLSDDGSLDAVVATAGQPLGAARAGGPRPVTCAPDDQPLAHRRRTARVARARICPA